MTLSVYVIIYVAVATIAGVCGITLILTSRSGYNLVVGVTCCLDYCVRCVVTNRTELVSLVSCLSTGGSLALNLSESVSESLDYIAALSLATVVSASINCCLTCYGTGCINLCLGLLHVVADCVYVIIYVAITTITGVSCITVLLTSRSGHLFGVGVVYYFCLKGLSAHLSATILAVYYGIIGALCGTGCSYNVLCNCIARNVCVGGLAAVIAVTCGSGRVHIKLD